MEYWSDAFRQKPNTPTLQYSDTAFLSIFSEVNLGLSHHRKVLPRSKAR
jgi:hypothetical protein